MRTIIKGRPPASLVRHRAAENSNYENYTDKATLRSHLVAEQRGLCCYCLRQIRSEVGQMKIEHWHPQEGFQDEQLKYSNLLGACMGNEGQPADCQTCDTRKGNRLLSRNPANPDHHVSDLVRFLGDGTIVSDDLVFAQELNDVLNLNEPFLRNNRKATLDAFQEILMRRGHLPSVAWEKFLDEWSGEANPGSDLQPFCQVVVYWIRKRLARA